MKLVGGIPLFFIDLLNVLEFINIKKVMGKLTYTVQALGNVGLFKNFFFKLLFKC